MASSLCLFAIEDKGADRGEDPGGSFGRAKGLYVLIVHLQEEEISELGDIICKADALSRKGGGQRPYFLGE